MHTDRMYTVNMLHTEKGISASITNRPRSHVEYLIPAYNIRLLLYHSHLAKVVFGQVINVITIRQRLAYFFGKLVVLEKKIITISVFFHIRVRVIKTGCRCIKALKHNYRRY